MSSAKSTTIRIDIGVGQRRAVPVSVRDSRCSEPFGCAPRSVAYTRRSGHPGEQAREAAHAPHRIANHLERGNSPELFDNPARVVALIRRHRAETLTPLLPRASRGCCCWPTAASLPTICGRPLQAPAHTCVGGCRRRSNYPCWRRCPTAPICPTAAPAQTRPRPDPGAIPVRVIRYTTTTTDGDGAGQTSELFTLAATLIMGGLLPLPSSPEP